MKVYISRKTYINVLSNFLIAFNWGQPKYPSVGKRINRLLYILTVEHCYIHQYKEQIYYMHQYDASQNYYAKWTKHGTKGYTTCDFTYMEYWKFKYNFNHRNQQISICLGPGMKQVIICKDIWEDYGYILLD